MKIDGLESIYASLDKSIKLVEGYTEFKGLGKIITSCNLKPYEWVFDQKIRAHSKYKIFLYRHWYDNDGNSIYLDTKTPKIVMNDLKVLKCLETDPYSQFSLENAVKISKTCFILLGKDEDLFSDFCLLGLLGIDNKVRCFCYMYGLWTKVSPLFLGLKYLKYLTHNKDLWVDCPEDKAWEVPSQAPILRVGPLPLKDDNVFQEHTIDFNFLKG